MFSLFFRLTSILGINPIPLFEGNWKGSYFINNHLASNFEMNTAVNQNNNKVLKGTILKTDELNILSPMESFILTFSIIYSSKQQKFIILFYNYDEHQLYSEIQTLLHQNYDTFFNNTIGKYGYHGFIPSYSNFSNISYFLHPSQIDIQYYYNDQQYLFSSQCKSHYSIFNFTTFPVFILLSLFLISISFGIVLLIK